MYEKELMMAIITASVALAGLEGVVIGQIVQSGLRTRIKKWLRIFLLFSFLFAILAVTQAIGWLTSPDGLERLRAVICFAVQLVVFCGVASVFWLSE